MQVRELFLLWLRMKAEALVPLKPELVDILLSNHRKFLDFLRHHVGSQAVAEDLLQQAFVRVIERGGQLQKEESVVAWFYRLLRNAMVDHYRANSAEDRKKELVSREGALAQSAQVAPPDELRAVICECVSGLLPTLRPQYAELLRKIDLDEQPIASVAHELGVTVNNLNVRLHRARQALRTSLQRSCGTCIEHGCLDCSCERPKV